MAAGAAPPRNRCRRLHLLREAQARFSLDEPQCVHIHLAKVATRDPAPFCFCMPNPARCSDSQCPVACAVTQRLHMSHPLFAALVPGLAASERLPQVPAPVTRVSILSASFSRRGFQSESVSEKDPTALAGTRTAPTPWSAACSESRGKSTHSGWAMVRTLTALSPTSLAPQALASIPTGRAASGGTSPSRAKAVARATWQ